MGGMQQRLLGNKKSRSPPASRKKWRLNIPFAPIPLFQFSLSVHLFSITHPFTLFPSPIFMSLGLTEVTTNTIQCAVISSPYWLVASTADI